MIKTSLAAALLVALVGCQSTKTTEATDAAPAPALSPEEVAVFMQACDNPNSAAEGPISQTLFVVGTFEDSEWAFVPQREFAYKGNNIYQAVVDEKPGTFTMQYAAEFWFPQFTAKDKSLNIGERKMLQFGGYGADTAVTIEDEGKYVWSLQFEAEGKPLTISLNKCQ
nr:glycosidase [Vibrio agarilyticus]